MNSEDQFRQQLNDILARKDFAFEEAQWEKMEALLQAKKRRRAIYLFFTAGILLLGSAFLLFNSVDERKTVAQQYNTTEHTAPAAPAIIHNDKDLSTSSKAPESSEPTVISPSAQPASVKPAVHPAVSQPATAQEPVKSSPGEPTVISAAAQPASVKPAVHPAVSQPATAQEPVKSSPQEPHSHNTHVNDQTDLVKNQQSSLPVQAAPAAPQEPESRKVQLPEILTPPSTDQSTGSNSDRQDQKPAEPLTANSPVAAPGTALPVSQANNNAANQPVTPAPEPVALTPTVDGIPLTKPDSLSPVAAMVMKPDTDYVKKKKVHLIAEAGTLFGFGWKEANGREATGFNPAGGLNLSYMMQGGLELNAGIHYNMSGYLKAGNYVATVTRLDLGVYSKVTVFTPTRLHYLSIPLRIYRHVNEKTAYGVGLTTSYLLTADSKVEQYDYSTSGGQTNYKSSKDRGYTQGFSNYDMQFALLAKRKLFRQLWLQGELLVGLKDVKTGSFIPSEGTERNSGIRMTIQYKLFSK